MKTHNGLNLDVITEVQIDGKTKFLCKLPHIQYVLGLPIRFIVLSRSEFVDYCDNIKKQSDEITTIPPSETICYPSKEV